MEAAAVQAEWSAAWRAAQPQVVAYCRRALRNQADADDVAQRVALRSWRAFPNFRGDCAFTTWALAIARREIIRFVQARKPETGTDLLDNFEAPPGDPSPDFGQLTRLRAACAALEKSGLASAQEAAILLARLKRPDATWIEIADNVGGDANSCAVAHCRAVPKLRLYLFIADPDALGGRAEIRDAYEAAARTPPPPGLTAREAELFRETVLAEGRGAPAALDRAAATLRTACEKVIRRMPMGV